MTLYFFFSFIQAHFSHPKVAAAVIIHLAADGTTYVDQTQCNITVQLVDTKEGIHSLGERRLRKLLNRYRLDSKQQLKINLHH